MFGLTKFRKLDLNTKIGKQTLIDGFVNKIYLYDDYALITCNYKDGQEKITFEDIEESGVSKSLKEQKNKPEQECSDLFKSGDPNGIRTHDTTVKGWCLNRLTMGPLLLADVFSVSLFSFYFNDFVPIISGSGGQIRTNDLPGMNRPL